MYSRMEVIGRLTSDLELKQLGAGEKAFDVVNASIAYNMMYKKNAEGKPLAQFLDFSATNATARNMAKYTGKGSKVFLTGELERQEWIDKNTQEKRHRWILNVDRAVFLDNPGENRQGQNQSGYNQQNQGAFGQQATAQNQGAFGQPVQNQGGFNQQAPTQNQGAFTGFNQAPVGQPDFSRNTADPFGGTAINISDNDLPF